jgi:hypothetical protein
MKIAVLDILRGWFLYLLFRSNAAAPGGAPPWRINNKKFSQNQLTAVPLGEVLKWGCHK